MPPPKQNQKQNKKKNKKKYCREPGCKTAPSYGIAGEGRRCCAKHKTAEMVNMVLKSCEVEGCMKLPSFGFEGQKATFCGTHKHTGMVNRRHKSCETEGCILRPSFGFENGSARFCGVHKQTDMRNLKNKVCAFEGCKTLPSYGYSLQGDRYCVKHKEDDMTRVWKKKPHVEPNDPVDAGNNPNPSSNPSANPRPKPKAKRGLPSIEKGNTSIVSSHNVVQGGSVEQQNSHVLTGQNTHAGPASEHVLNDRRSIHTTAASAYSTGPPSVMQNTSDNHVGSAGSMRENAVTNGVIHTRAAEPPIIHTSGHTTASGYSTAPSIMSILEAVGNSSFVPENTHSNSFDNGAIHTSSRYSTGPPSVTHSFEDVGSSSIPESAHSSNIDNSAIHTSSGHATTPSIMDILEAVAGSGSIPEYTDMLDNVDSHAGRKRGRGEIDDNDVSRRVRRLEDASTDHISTGSVLHTPASVGHSRPSVGNSPTGLIYTLIESLNTSTFGDFPIESTTYTQHESMSMDRIGTSNPAIGTVSMQTLGTHSNGAIHTQPQCMNTLGNHSTSVHNYTEPESISMSGIDKSFTGVDGMVQPDMHTYNGEVHTSIPSDSIGMSHITHTHDINTSSNAYTIDIPAIPVTYMNTSAGVESMSFGQSMTTAYIPATYYSHV